ncbi:MAG: class I SAM-dependent methyltransferase [Pseudomonadota bacterium]
MIGTMKVVARRWQREGRYPLVTSTLRKVWQGAKNAGDRGRIARVDRALAEGRLPDDPAAAVAMVMDDPAFAAVRPIQQRDELTGLIELVAARKPRVLMEIGTARGGTLMLMTRFAAQDAVVVSVDLPFGRNGGGYPEWKVPHYRGFATEGQTLHLIRGDSHAEATRREVEGLLGAKRIEFLMIDGDHSAEGVARDHALWSPLMAPGGIMALHDVLENRFDPSIDVNRFWATLEADPAISTRLLVGDPDQGNFGIGLVEMPG